MKVEVNSQALADAVAWTTRVIDARPATPILAGIRLEAIDGTLQLSAFNYAISARHHIEAGVDEAGSVLVLGKLLADITKSLPAAKTYLSTDGSTMTITSGKSTFTMQLMPESEYPDLPVVPTKLGQVDSPTFAQAVNQASVAVSREENRPVLTGIRVQFQGDKVIMSSTDRFRLARSSFTWTPEDATISTTALVRGSLLRDMARSLDEHQNVTIDFDADNPSLLGFENAGRVSTSQLIDGEFPAVDRLYADEYPIHAVINKQALIDAIRSGVVDAIATDHAPHSEEDKLKGMAGMVGSETAFGVCYTKLCKEEGLPLELLSHLMSTRPAEILGLAKGQLEPGYDADFVLVDLDILYTVDKNKLHSKSHNCPFDGAQLYGRVCATVKGGELTYQAEE